MRRFACKLLAVSSLLLALTSLAETRPQYGGTLRIAMQIAPVSLDPVQLNQFETVAARNLTRLVFDTLVTLDDSGRIRPGLATSWQADAGNQRWQLWIRPALRWQDGSAVTADSLAASLRSANPSWNVSAHSDALIIESAVPLTTLLPDLALPRNAVGKRTPEGPPLGTGPFKISDWQPGRRLTLSATEDYWAGRAFLDAVVIDLGKSPREQALGLELSKYDVVEIVPEQVRHAIADDRRIAVSAPMQLSALVFSKDPQSPEEARLRTALSLAIDRNAIRNVLLQGQGEICGALLPNWLSGYAFVFPAELDLRRAQEIRGDVARGNMGTLAYDASDPVSRFIAERIVLNARDAGITLQATNSTSADLRLITVSLASLNPQLALARMAAELQLPQPRLHDSSEEELFRAEDAILQSQRVIPLLQLPAAFALSQTVRGFPVARDGAWDVPNVSLERR
ncbi:MAG TPA: ABC transporter substrate-binding protein [Terriglobales bacterium]|nr:ABC transporter substrate-binding protein [Terriglobales bacterium]